MRTRVRGIFGGFLGIRNWRYCFCGELSITFGLIDIGVGGVRIHFEDPASTSVPEISGANGGAREASFGAAVRAVTGRWSSPLFSQVLPALGFCTFKNCARQWHQSKIFLIPPSPPALVLGYTDPSTKTITQENLENP